MWCGTVLRHVRSHERCRNCVVRHRIHIIEWPEIHLSISWGFIYAGLDDTLINPNQLHLFHTQVQYNPYHATEPMSITNPSGDFTACLESQGTNIFLNTWFPSQTDLSAFPHIKLTSRQPWNPHQIEFASTKHYRKKDIEAQNVSSIGIKIHQPIEDDKRHIKDEEDIIFNTQRFNHKLVTSVLISQKQVILVEVTTREKQGQVAKLVTEQLVKDIHIDNVPEPLQDMTDNRQPRAFLSAEQHSNTPPEDLSKHRGISVAQTALTLKATTQKLVQSAIMPLRCRYRAERMFNIKILQCVITTDTMHKKFNSIHGNYYCQDFGNKEFFVEAYPMENKSDFHEALDQFVRYYVATDSTIYDGA